MRTANEGQAEPLPVTTDAKLKSAFGHAADKYTHGIHTGDTSWKPVHDLIKELQAVLPNFGLVDSSYDTGWPNKYKKWTLVGAFQTPAGAMRAVWGQIKAHGAGSVEDPLERYDLTFVSDTLSPRNITGTKEREYLERFIPETREASLSLMLDGVAESLESKGFLKEAEEIDALNNTLEASENRIGPPTSVFRKDELELMSGQARKVLARFFSRDELMKKGQEHDDKLYHEYVDSPRGKKAYDKALKAHPGYNTDKAEANAATEMILEDIGVWLGEKGKSEAEVNLWKSSLKDKILAGIT